MGSNKTVLFKNGTANDLVVRGRMIRAGSPVVYRRFDSNDFFQPLLFEREAEITAQILAGDIIVNNGIEDLSPTDGVLWVFGEFDTTDGTIGASANATTGKMLQLDFENPSSIGGDWLQSGGMPTNETPVIVPFDSRLVSITFSNKERGADTELQIQAVSETDGRSPSPTIITWTIDNARTARRNDFGSPQITFSKGDKIAVFAEQRGNTDPSQVKMTMHLLVLEDDLTTHISNWNGDIS